MARSVAWKRTASDTTSWRQDQALNSTAFIVSEVGPMGFIIKMADENKPVKVMLGDPHSCTCAGFRNEHNELCKHICWLLLKRFRLAREDPMSWQLGLVEREVDALLVVEQTRRRMIRNRPQTPRRTAPAAQAQSKDGRPVLEQREVTEEDSCPICMEDLLSNKQPVTYCRYGCSNNIHIKCMKIWAEHQTKAGEQTVRCPFCREDFGPIEDLREEYRNTAVGTGGILHRHSTTKHVDTTCKQCNQSPIQGKYYRCMHCPAIDLCQKCFNTTFHSQHPFEFKAVPAARWRPAQRVNTNGVPVAPSVMNNLANREIGDGDYDLLLQLDNPNANELSQIPETVIKKLPLELVRIGSKHLSRGEQCCICLRAYHVSDYVRKLPCRHRFHRACVDNWLLHQHPTCPVCGYLVWSRLSAEQEPAGSRRRVRAVRRLAAQEPAVASSNPEPSLEIPGHGIARRETRSANSENLPSNPQRRVPRAGSTLSESATSNTNRNAGGDNILTLAHLLHTEAIATDSSQLNADDDQHDYILSQISHSAPPSDLSRPPQSHLSSSNRSGLNTQRSNTLPSVNGLLLESSGAIAYGGATGQGGATRNSGATSYGGVAEYNGATGYRGAAGPGGAIRNSGAAGNNGSTGAGGASGRNSNSDGENMRRRARNLALAAKSQRVKEANSQPSISTSQPADASGLYLGNAAVDGQRVSELPLGRHRGALQRPASKSKPQTQTIVNGASNLSIGAATSQLPADNKPRVCRPKNPAKARPQPALVSNQAPLELNGFALEN